MSFTPALTSTKVSQELRRYLQSVTPSVLRANIQCPLDRARAALERLTGEGGCIRDDVRYRPLADHEIRAQHRAPFRISGSNRSCA